MTTRTEQMKDESLNRFILRYIQKEREKHPEELQRRLARQGEYLPLSESELREQSCMTNTIEVLDLP